MAGTGIACVVAAAGFTVGGILLHRHACRMEEELSSMQKVQFRDFHELRDHLWNCPGREANVLVEGKVEKLNNGAISSENTGIEGAAQKSSTVIQEYVYDRQTGWCKTFRTTDHVNDSVPFKLVDTQGSPIRVKSVHRAHYLQGVLKQVFKQEKALPGLYSKFDETFDDTSVTVPTFSTIQDNVLVFGTDLAGYGRAVLTESSYFGAGGGKITFTPEEVSWTITIILVRRKFIARMFRIATTLCFGCAIFVPVFLIGGLLKDLPFKIEIPEANDQ